MRILNEMEIKETLKLHIKWINGEEGGQKANLSGANLTKANLSWENLSWANLSGANLTKANLTKANLSWANLTKANLSWANLSGANLSGANLTKANLTKANLSGANLSGANLTKANLWITQWPLWCGTRKVKIDLKIARQLAAHFCAVECESPEYKRIRKLIIKFAMKSHVSEELKLKE